jgi:histidyl-tRNA synthetase
MGCPYDAVVVDPSLARGLNYYTEAIYECVLVEGAKLGLSSTLAAGGRYDDIIGGFCGNTKPGAIPAVGISFGLDILEDAINLSGKNLDSQTGPRVYVLGIQQSVATCIAASVFRKAGISCTLDLMNRSLSKNLEAASKGGFSFAVIIGAQESDAGKVKLRDLSSGAEKLLTLSEAVEAVATTSKKAA